MKVKIMEYKINWIEKVFYESYVTAESEDEAIEIASQEFGAGNYRETNSKMDIESIEAVAN